MTSSVLSRPRAIGLSGPTWLVWRLNRTAFWTGLAVALAFAVYAVVQHQHIAAAVAQQHLDACHGSAETSDACFSKIIRFGAAHQFSMRHPLQVMAVVPLIFGLFLGAPQMAQELESGTYRTVCSQSVTRLRWFAAKLAVPVVMTVVISGVLAAAMTWWWKPAADVMGSQFPWYLWYPFDGIGPVVVGQSVLMLLIGVTFSLILRRTVMAMGATLVAGAGVLLALERVRGHLLPTLTATARHTSDVPGPDNAWVMAEGPLSPSESAHGGTGRWAEYHPASQLWPLQWAETGLCLLLAGALAALCVWWVRRRMT